MPPLELDEPDEPLIPPLERDEPLASRLEPLDDELPASRFDDEPELPDDPLDPDEPLIPPELLPDDAFNPLPELPVFDEPDEPDEPLLDAPERPDDEPDELLASRLELPDDELLGEPLVLAFLLVPDAFWSRSVMILFLRIPVGWSPPAAPSALHRVPVTAWRG